MLSYSCFFQVRAQENFMEIPAHENFSKVNIAAENQMLQRRLLLNEDQFHKVETINTERNELLDQVAGMYRFDPENYNKKAMELELQYDAEFEKVLTKQQYTEYLALKGRDKHEEPKLQTENPELASETDELNKNTKPSFNDQIHAILEKATAIKVDSSLIAKQDNDFRPLTPDEQLILEGLRPQNAALLEIRGDTLKNQKTVAKTDVKVDSASASEGKTEPAILSEVQRDTSKNEVIANTEAKPDGECKTCFDVNQGNNPEQVALNNPKKKTTKGSWKTAESENSNRSNTEMETDSLFLKTPDGANMIDEKAAIIPGQPLN